MTFMSTCKKRTKDFLHKARNSLERLYHRRKKRFLHNEDFTIISSNCIAGIIYHDLELTFLTPTINLYFDNDDFFRFVGNIDFYLNCEIEEFREDGTAYPLGKMTCGEESVVIRFMHYKSFQEAAAKWKERAARVRKDNLYVIFEYPAVGSTIPQQQEMKQKFDAIPFEHKVMLTKKTSPLTGDNIQRLSYYEKDYYPGKFIAPDKRFPIRRYLDRFHYISFLNKKTKRS